MSAESIGSVGSLFKKAIGYAPQFYRNRALHKTTTGHAATQELYPAVLCQFVLWLCSCRSGRRQFPDIPPHPAP